MLTITLALRVGHENQSCASYSQVFVFEVACLCGLYFLRVVILLSTSSHRKSRLLPECGLKVVYSGCSRCVPLAMLLIVVPCTLFYLLVEGTSSSFLACSSYRARALACVVDPGSLYRRCSLVPCRFRNHLCWFCYCCLLSTAIWWI